MEIEVLNEGDLRIFFSEAQAVANFFLGVATRYPRFSGTNFLVRQKFLRTFLPKSTISALARNLVNRIEKEQGRGLTREEAIARIPFLGSKPSFCVGSADFRGEGKWLSLKCSDGSEIKVLLAEPLSPEASFIAFVRRPSGGVFVRALKNGS